jgi:hypothetical protein
MLKKCNHFKGPDKLSIPLESISKIGFWFKIAARPSFPAARDFPPDLIIFVGRPALRDFPSDLILLVGRPAFRDFPSDLILFVGHKPQHTVVC